MAAFTMSRSGFVPCLTRSRKRSNTITAERGTMTAPGLARSGFLGSRGTRQGHRQLEHFVIVLPLEVHLNRLGIDVDVFFDHFEKLTTQQGEVVRAPSGATLLGNNDTQPLLGNAGGRGVTTEKRE